MRDLIGEIWGRSFMLGVLPRQGRAQMAQQIPRLFTYTVCIDDGAAPNPFRGMCSLAICKPGIRSVAKQGDWVAGLGSKKALSGDLSGKLVYAMLIDDVLSFEEYDRRASADWPHRIPNVDSSDLSERLGDCIYDFSSGVPVQRRSVHGPENVATDLNGKNVLLSRNFYYFGGHAYPLPDDLLAICHQTQGHKSNANAPYFQRFVTWLQGLDLTPGQLYGWPDFIIDWAAIASCGGCITRKLDGEKDDEIDDPA